MLAKKIVNYVSDIDKFFTEFDKAHPKSESQKAEINKYKHIYKLRDKKQKLKTEE